LNKFIVGNIMQFYQVKINMDYFLAKLFM